MKHRTVVIGLLLASVLSVAWAHDYWLKPDGARIRLVYGDAAKVEPYDRRVVKSVAGVRADGTAVAVDVQPADGSCFLSTSTPVAEIGAVVDTGYWTKSMRGWENKAKREVGSALLSEWSVYYSTIVLSPQDCLGRSLGHRFEFVVLQADPNAATLELRLDGKPVAEKAVYGHDHRKIGDTDRQGRIQLERNGFLSAVAAHKEPLENNPDAERMHLHAVLTMP